MDMRVFSLFDDSNIEAYDKRDERYPAVLEAGLTQHGLDFDDVLAVTKGLGFWAICKQGIFHARLKGVFTSSRRLTFHSCSQSWRCESSRYLGRKAQRLFSTTTVRSSLLRSSSHRVKGA